MNGTDNKREPLKMDPTILAASKTYCSAHTHVAKLTAKKPEANKSDCRRRNAVGNGGRMSSNHVVTPHGTTPLITLGYHYNICGETG
jgi:hypothetical protein